MKATASLDPKEILDGVPPNDAEAEMALLGAVFLRADVLDDVSLIVSPSDFYDPRNTILFEGLCRMHNAGEKIDSALYAAMARKEKVWSGDFGMGGAAYLAEILQACPTAANANYYAAIVRDMAIKRDLRIAGQMIMQSGHRPETEGPVAMNEAEEIILKIRDKRGALTSRVTTVASVLSDAMAALEDRASGKVSHGLDTGFVDLDRLVGFRPSELLILAARPSMGKTALALNIASNLAAESRKPVLFFSLEMNALTVGDRLLSSWSEVDGERMRRGVLTPQERTAIIEASAALSQSPFMLDDSHVLKVQDIMAVSRRQKRRKGLALIVVDYLQLIQPENARDPREQQVAQISRRLKGLARELEVPVLCLAQLNRQVETGADKRPRLSHLRESGAIEQDADVVFFVHRPEYYLTNPADRNAVKGQAEVIVEKNRNGRTGLANLVWREHIVTFSNASAKDLDNYSPEFDAYNEG